MKKSLLPSFLVIGVVAAMITAATTALFNDTVTSSNNSFASGVVDLAADNLCDETAAPYGGPCEMGTVSFTGAAGVQALNLKPGESVSHTFTIANAGSLDFTYVTNHAWTGGLSTCSGAATVAVTGGQNSDGSGAIGAAADSNTDTGTESVTVTVTLPAGAAVDNSCQGQTGDLDITFVASQLP